MVPEFADSDGAATSREARAFWGERWQGRTLMAVGALDPVMGLPLMQRMQKLIRNCPEPMVLEQAGHFVQEHGEPAARAAVQRFR
jgi:tRNA(adenine34) deaminase